MPFCFKYMFCSFMYFFLNALLLLLSFLSMISHSLIFPYVHLYLLLYHPVPLRFFLSFSFSVVFNLSFRETVVLPSQFFSLLLFFFLPLSSNLHSLCITLVCFLCFPRSFSLSSTPLKLSAFQVLHIPFVLVTHYPLWDKAVAEKWRYLRTSANNTLFNFLKEPVSQGDQYWWCTLHTNSNTNCRCYSQNPHFHCTNEAQFLAQLSSSPLFPPLQVYQRFMFSK